MILKDYVKKLELLVEEHGEKECIFSGDPDGTHFYWLTADPEGVHMVSDKLEEGLCEILKDDINTILIN